MQGRRRDLVAVLSLLISSGVTALALFLVLGGSATAGGAAPGAPGASTAKVVFVDVDQGDGVAMRIGGKIIVSDAGPPAKALRMDKELDALGANGHIDVAILSHGHYDHVGGLSKLVSDFGYEIDLLVASPNGKWETKTNQEILDTLQIGGGAAIDWVKRGDSFDWGGASWTILNPVQGAFTATSSVENSSVVTLLEVNGRRVLFTGDIKEQATTQLASNWGDLGRTHILLVTHHGSKFGSSEALLAKLQPRFAVVSAGEQNNFTHPWPATIERLQAPEAQTERIYCTVANETVRADRKSVV